MKESIRIKIEGARSSNRPAPLEEYNPSLVAKAIAQEVEIEKAVEQAMSGEREYSIAEIAKRHGLKYHLVYQVLKGRPGYKVYGKRGGVRITETLYRSFLADAIKRGLACR